MVNNFAVIYMKKGEFKKAFILLQCAIHMSRHYPDLQTIPQLISVLYSNLSFYYLQGKSKASDQSASKYIDGAIIANKRHEISPNSQKNNQRSQPEDRKAQIQNEIDLAISYNNKAVIEMKRNNMGQAREFAIKAVTLIEPRVYGMISSGFVNRINPESKPNGPAKNSETQEFFQHLLQVLLISYFNLAMTRDHELQSRNIYLKGMQLCYQYLPGGQKNYLF